jgi:hypothetical protein
VETRSEERRVVSALLKANQDVFSFDEQGGGGVDKVSEYMPGLGFAIPIAQFTPEQAVKAAFHEGCWRSRFTLIATEEHRASI